ncbi:beta-hexosaminidase subunit beta-like [Crocuta crocuta]
MPLSVKTSPRLLQLSRDNFSIANDPSSTAGPTCSLLQEAFRRYHEYIFGFNKRQRRPAKPNSVVELQQLVVTVVLDSECDLFPSITSDESCEYLRDASLSCSELLVGDLSAGNRFHAMNYCELLANEFIIFIFKYTIKV